MRRPAVDTWTVDNLPPLSPPSPQLCWCHLLLLMNARGIVYVYRVKMRRRTKPACGLVTQIAVKRVEEELHQDVFFESLAEKSHLHHLRFVYLVDATLDLPGCAPSRQPSIQVFLEVCLFKKELGPIIICINNLGLHRRLDGDSGQDQDRAESYCK